MFVCCKNIVRVARKGILIFPLSAQVVTVNGMLLRSALRIRIRRINMCLCLPDPNLFVRDTDPDPDPSIIKQK
jgi:hypothetical protein